LSRVHFKKIERILTKDLRNEIVECCLIPREKSKTRKIFTKKLSQNVWRTEKNGAFLNLMVDAINKADETIGVSSFLIDDNILIQALVNASKRGVRVYLLTSEQKIEADSEHDDFISLKTREEHLKLLDDLAGLILVRTADHFHSKFILIDPMNEKKSVGFLLTANLKKKPLLGTNELGVMLKGKTVQELFELFCHAFWTESEHELFEPGRFKVVIRKQGIQLPPISHLLYTNKSSTNLKDNIISFIKNTSGDLLISSYGFDDNYELTNLIIKQIRNGRNITILAPTRPRLIETLRKFQEAGAEVLLNDYHHAKAILVLNNTQIKGLIFTANLTSKGLDTGFETGFNVQNDDLLELERIFREWRDEFSYSLKTNVPLGEIRDSVQIFENGSLVKKEIQSHIIIDLGEIEAESLSSMESTSPKIPLVNPSNQLGYEIHYKWTVVPPVLPKQAKKVKEENGLPIYQQKNQKFILVSNERELKKATQLAKKYHAKIVV